MNLGKFPASRWCEVGSRTEQQRKVVVGIRKDLIDIYIGLDISAFPGDRCLLFSAGHRACGGVVCDRLHLGMA